MEHKDKEHKDKKDHKEHTTHHAHHPKKPTIAPIHIIIATLIGVVLIYNGLQIAGINSLIDGEAPEPPKLPEIQLLLVDADCEQCSDLGQLISALSQQGQFEVTDHRTVLGDSVEGEKLIEDHELEFLPAIVVVGDEVSIEGFTETDNGLKLEAPAPYYDIKSASVFGLVDVEYVLPENGTCPDCTDITLISQQLQQAGIAVASENSFAADTDDGQRLIEAYELEKLPAAIFSSDLEAYEFITAQWRQTGTVAPDGSYVMREVTPPFYDLETETVRGIINLISIVDESCDTCYDVALHKQILTNFGIAFGDETEVDVSSSDGKNLLAQYNITLIPTVIITGDPDLYPALGQVWSSVGTVEEDGAYIFRRTDLLQGASYKNVETGEVTNVAVSTV